MHPEDVADWYLPDVVRSFNDVWWIRAEERLLFLTRLPVADGLVPLLGSEQGFDSIRWSVENDAALAKFAAQALEARDPTAAASLAADLELASRTAVEGFAPAPDRPFARPATHAVARIVRAALESNALAHDELLRETQSLATFAPIGGCTNDVFADARDHVRMLGGDWPFRWWRDAVAILSGCEDEAQRLDVLDAVERILRTPTDDREALIARIFEVCTPLLRPHGELSLFVTRGAKGYWGRTGSRAQLIRIRRGDAQWLTSESASSEALPHVQTIDTYECDTYWLLYGSESAAAVLSAIEATRNVVRPVEPLRDALRREFIERLQAASVGGRPLSMQHLATAPLASVANAIHDAIGSAGDTTMGLLRVLPWRPPADFYDRIDHLLRLFAARSGIEARLKSATITQERDWQTASGHLRRLDIGIEIDATVGEARARLAANAFVASIRARHPQLCGSHSIVVEPLRLHRSEAATARVAFITRLAQSMLEGKIGLSARVKVLPTWGDDEKIEVLVLRDDVYEADDEDAAANAIRKAVLRADPSLASLITVYGNYIK